MSQKLELQHKIDEINRQVNETMISDNPEICPITDGIIDIDKYLKAKYKILWILKEPYDDFDENGKPFGGGWSLNEVLNQKQTISEFKGGRPTYKPMIYTSWGILNDFCLWENMGNVENDPSMIDALKSIAYINVKKLPGYTKSHFSVIENAYQKYKDILLNQIEFYQPNIIIGGSTLYNFFKDLDLRKELMQKRGSIDFILKNNRIYIDAYHPSQRRISQEQYCDDIITTVKELSLNIKI